MGSDMEVVSVEAIGFAEIAGVVSGGLVLMLVGILGKERCKEGEEGSEVGIEMVVSEVQ